MKGIKLRASGTGLNMAEAKQWQILQLEAGRWFPSLALLLLTCTNTIRLFIRHNFIMDMVFIEFNLGLSAMCFVLRDIVQYVLLNHMTSHPGPRRGGGHEIYYYLPLPTTILTTPSPYTYVTYT